MRLSSIRPAVAVVLALGLALGATAQEEVDFSKSPAAGLKFKVVSKISTEGSQSMTMGERAMEMTMKGERATTFTDAILEVKEGKITKMEREYEDVNNKQVAEAEGREPRERDVESPLAWKHFRVEWDADGEATVKVKDEDEWADPEDKLKKQLRPKRLRRALFPLPQEAKSVGDTWELSEETIKNYFPKPQARGGGEDAPEIEREVTGSLEFTEITDYREMKCAVVKANLEMKMEIGDLGTSTSKMTQTCYYSLEHRIVVGVKGTTESGSSISTERRGRSFEQESTSKGTSEVVVTIEQPGKKEEAGE